MMHLLIYLVMILVSASAFSQDILKGVVAEENEKGEFSPLVGANVYWLGTTEGTTTNEKGIFELECSHDNHRLVVSYIGYLPDTIQIKNHEELAVILKNVKSLDAVNITYRKKTTEVSFMDVMRSEIITGEELYKAACCNLSESFETNPTVDVAFTDAVTGTRQIQMLGLAGTYVQISQESMPSVRGLSANFGLTHIPGPWIESIQVIKGTGSVVNGHESVAGQINVELKKPTSKEKLFLNAFFNQEGRMELNLNTSQRVNHKWSTATLLHGHVKPFKVDGNGDGFQDFPKGYSGSIFHRWKLDNQKGVMSQAGIRYIKDDWRGGQMNFNPELPRDTSNGYGVNLESQKVEVFGKLGYVFKEKKYKSIGFQGSGSWYNLDAYFGLTDYEATQYNVYTNLIYQSILGTTQNKFKTGISYMMDIYDEVLDTSAFDRSEHVPGAFFEYSFTHLDRVTLVAGVRVDYNSIYGVFATPRLHARFAITENTVIRLTGGRGQRTANIIAENTGILATSRAIRIINANDKPGYRLNPEVAWNYGINITQNFKLGGRDGMVSADFYRTDFQDQVVIDFDDNPQEVLFYNLEGRSFSNSVQVQFDYEVYRNLDLRLAYRWFDVKTDYTKGLLQKPLIANHRAFANVAYQAPRGWKIDFTLQWQGQKRIPSTNSNPPEYQLASYAPHFFLMNTQVTKMFKKGVDIYIGMENIANYKQDNPILASDEPFGPYFDSSMIWGPIYGRNTYVGLRYQINHDK